jgi:hypothetical protein
MSGNAFEESKIIEDSTPAGNKAWLLQDTYEPLHGRFLRPANVTASLIQDVLICWSRDDDTSQALAGVRFGGTNAGYYGGIGISTQAINKSLLGSSSALTTGAASTRLPNYDRWKFTRINGTGTTIQTKTWDAGRPEPEAWEATTTDASITTGYPGIFVYMQAGITPTKNNPHIKIAYFASGVTAPMPTGYELKKMQFYGADQSSFLDNLSSAAFFVNGQEVYRWEYSE